MQFEELGIRKHRLNDRHMLVLSEAALQTRVNATDLAHKMEADRKMVGNLCHYLVGRGLLDIQRGVDEEGQRTFFSLTQAGDLLMRAWARRLLTAIRSTSSPERDRFPEHWEQPQVDELADADDEFERLMREAFKVGADLPNLHQWFGIEVDDGFVVNLCQYLQRIPGA